jgi:UDP-2-acetamido-3-amino-2,3-dideoxy-glucuronate N-acetyltransferase
METKIHPTAIVDEGAQIGEGSKIWHFCHVVESAKIGTNCNIGQNCYVAGIVGDNCKIQNNVNIYLGVELGDYVFCGPSMTFTNDLNPRAKYPKNGEYIKTSVEEGVSIGANCTIVCGIKIGKWAMIGAGSVVTKDVPAYALMYGNPAKLQGWVSEHGEKLEFGEDGMASCPKSGEKYIIENNIVSKSN